jgi:hypothetical protein
MKQSPKFAGATATDGTVVTMVGTAAATTVGTDITTVIGAKTFDLIGI